MCCRGIASGSGLGGCSILQEWCKEEVRVYERVHELLSPCTQAVERLERIGRVNHLRMVAQSSRIKRATDALVETEVHSKS